jgi:leucyl aminopeptidase
MLTYADRKCKPEVIWDLANLTRMLTRMLTYADTYADRKCKPEVIWDLANLRKKVGIIEISRKGLLEKAYFIVPRISRFLTHADVW